MSFPISFQPSNKQIIIQPRVGGNSEQLEQRLLESGPESEKTVGNQSDEREKNEKKDAKSRKSKIKKNKVADKAAKSKNNKKKGKTKGGSEKKENEKLSQQTTHVQFSFDDYTPPDDVTKTTTNTEAPVLDEPDNVLAPPPPTTACTNELQIREDGDPVIDLTGQRKKRSDNDQNGNYDELPVIRIDDNSNYETGATGMRSTNTGSGLENEITALSRSSESIPFIDEGDTQLRSRSPRLHQRNQLAVYNQPSSTSSQSSSQLSLTPYYQSQYHHHHLHHHQPPHQPVHNQFESRIITLIPKNFESHNLITPTGSTVSNLAANVNSTTTAIVPMQTFLPVKLSHQVQISGATGQVTATSTRPIHILPRIDEQRDEPHKFHYYYNPGYKMCQICHLYLHVCPAIKCYECEFVCHRQCLSKVSEKFLFTFINSFKKLEHVSSTN